MKAPSKNVSSSLRSQRAPGRAQENIGTSRLTSGGSMTVPGEGGVERPPGRTHVNEACYFADPLGSHFGG
jgi:hypothetical protein